jgi:hypothetical protein
VWRSGVKGSDAHHSEQAGRAPVTVFIHWNSFFFSLVLPILCRNLINFINKSCSSISDLHLCLKVQPKKIKGFEDLEFWNQAHWNLTKFSFRHFQKLFWLAKFGELISGQPLINHHN